MSRTWHSCTLFSKLSARWMARAQAMSLTWHSSTRCSTLLAMDGTHKTPLSHCPVFSEVVAASPATPGKDAWSYSTDTDKVGPVPLEQLPQAAAARSSHETGGNDMKALWYYKKGAYKVGPFSGDLLQQLALAGQLLPTDMMSQGDDIWVTATSVPGLFPSPAPSCAGEPSPAPSPAVALCNPAGTNSSTASAPTAKSHVWGWLCSFGGVVVVVLLAIAGAVSHNPQLQHAIIDLLHGATAPNAESLKGHHAG